MSAVSQVKFFNQIQIQIEFYAAVIDIMTSYYIYFIYWLHVPYGPLYELYCCLFVIILVTIVNCNHDYSYILCYGSY